jgi:hypothetical protein
LLASSCALDAEPTDGRRCHHGYCEQEPELGSTTQAFRTILSGADHEDITEWGLPFLKEDVVDEIGDANEYTDMPLFNRGERNSNSNHFDNCNIAQSLGLIRMHYERVVKALDPANMDHEVAIERFGTIMHAIQDFYSHSNWVESGQQGLFSENGFDMPRGAPGTRLGSMVIVGIGMPNESTLFRAYGSRIPLVRVHDEYHYGLMTGTFEGNTGPQMCPASVALPHDPPMGIHNPHLFLSKDHPDSLNHHEALSFAMRQTTEEFCRLMRLVMLRYGEAGRSALLKTWVRSQAAYETACPNDRALVAGVWIATT